MKLGPRGGRKPLADQFAKLLRDRGVTTQQAADRAGLSVEQVELALQGKGRWCNADRLAAGLGRYLVIRDAIVRPRKVSLVDLASRAGLAINTVQECIRHCNSPRASDGCLLVSSVEAFLFALNPHARVELVNPGAQ